MNHSFPVTYTSTPSTPALVEKASALDTDLIRQDHGGTRLLSRLLPKHVGTFTGLDVLFTLRTKRVLEVVKSHVSDGP